MAGALVRWCVARCGGGGRASPGGVPSTVVRGAWCQAPSLPRPLVLRSVQPGFRDPRVPGAVDAGMWTQHRPHSVRPCGPALLAVGVAEGRPRGGAFHRCEGRLVSGAVPPPAALALLACSQGSATRVSRARSMRACGPSTGPTACALAGRRCSLWGWRNGVPGGGAFHRCEGRLVSGAVPSLAARPPERAARVPRPACPGRGRCGRVDPVPVPRRAPLRAGVVRRGGGGRASPGGAAFRRCEGRLVSGTVPSSAARPPERAARFRDPRVPGAVDAGSGPSTGPTACALAGRRCPLWGWRKGVPGGGAFHRREGRLVSGAVPPPATRLPERAARVPRPVCPGGGRCGRVDPAPAPQRAPLRAGVARCGGGGRASPGGVPSTVVRGAWCQALSLPRPLVLRSVQPGFRDPRVPGAVDAGVWTQHRPHSARPCGPALLAVGVAGGRPRGGCLPPL